MLKLKAQARVVGEHKQGSITLYQFKQCNLVDEKANNCDKILCLCVCVWVKCLIKYLLLYHELESTC